MIKIRTMKQIVTSTGVARNQRCLSYTQLPYQTQDRARRLERYAKIMARTCDRPLYVSTSPIKTWASRS